jgi:hypothetical protein
MAQTLTLDLPTTVFDTLVDTAKRTGRPLEAVATDWVEKAAIQAVDDPLLQLAGAFESDVKDVAARHDEFLGQQLKDTHD